MLLYSVGRSWLFFFSFKPQVCSGEWFLSEGVLSAEKTIPQWNVGTETLKSDLNMMH